MRFIELFAGIGGLSHGLEDAGMDLAVGFEVWDKALDVLRYNLPSGGQAWKMDLSDVATSARTILQWSPDLIAGGPPCQDYASPGKGNIGKNAALTEVFAMLIAVARPRWFLMENTIRAPLSRTYRNARKIWKRAGYGLTEVYVNSAHYGTAQARKRFIVVGRLGEQDQFLESAIVEAASAKPVPVSSILNPETYLDDAELIRAGGYFVRPYSGGRGVHRLDAPAPTIIRTSVEGPTRGYKANPHPDDHIHYSEAFRLTAHQAQRIQGFPPNFDMGGFRLATKGKPWSKRDTMQMIANAVPPPLACKLGEAILAREAGQSIPALHEGFGKWLLDKGHSKTKVSNVKSRVNRVRRFLGGRTYVDVTLELAALEAVPEFAAMPVRQKSDLRAALRLYAEFPRPGSKFLQKIREKTWQDPFGRRTSATVILNSRQRPPTGFRPSLNGPDLDHPSPEEHPTYPEE